MSDKFDSRRKKFEISMIGSDELLRWQVMHQSFDRYSPDEIPWQRLKRRTRKTTTAAFARSSR